MSRPARRTCSPPRTRPTRCPRQSSARVVSTPPSCTNPPQEQLLGDRIARRPGRHRLTRPEREPAVRWWPWLALARAAPCREERPPDGRLAPPPARRTTLSPAGP